MSVPLPLAALTLLCVKPVIIILTQHAQVVEAHGLGSRVPSIHNGAMVLGGVRALTTRHDDTELLSGGSDGVVIVWDITGGTLGRALKKVEVSHQFAEDRQGVSLTR